MLNHHSITKVIISLTSTLLQCYYFNTLGVDYIYTGSVDLTLEVLLCTNNKEKVGDFTVLVQSSRLQYSKYMRNRDVW